MGRQMQGSFAERSKFTNLLQTGSGEGVDVYGEISKGGSVQLYRQKRITRDRDRHDY